MQDRLVIEKGSGANVKNYRMFHVTRVLANGFHSEFSKDDTRTQCGQLIYDEVKKIIGVTFVSVNDYELTVCRAIAFDFEVIISRVTSILERHISQNIEIIND